MFQISALQQEMLLSSLLELKLIKEEALRNAKWIPEEESLTTEIACIDAQMFELRNLKEVD